MMQNAAAVQNAPLQGVIASSLENPSAHELLDVLPIAAALIDKDHACVQLNPLMAEVIAGDNPIAASDLVFESRGGHTGCLRLGDDRYRVSVHALPNGSTLVLSHDSEHSPTALQHHKLDTLTGLPDRSVLDAVFKNITDGVADNQCAVLLIDLDRFKNVNDTLGHPVGDALLIQVVERLKSAIREDDILLRLGGDEFALIQCDAKQPEAANGLAKRLIDLVSRTYLLGQHVVNIGASIGISIMPSGTANAAEMLKRADLALYRSKDSGRGQHHIFSAEMEQSAQHRRALEADLRKAVILRQFVVHYQPLADLGNRTITGVEALVRWQHPTRGLVAPDDFIPLAEETGLILQIGDFVLNKACQAAAKWPDQQLIAVNVSSVQIESEDFVQSVEKALSRSGLAANRLEIEVTESLMINNVEAALKVLTALKALGVRIVMDDFGTGYSSLSYLRSFPFDKVKIDRSFISELDSGPKSAGVIKAIVDLGLTLGMKTTAEGVETIEQLEHLRSEGCNQVQGYFISRPVAETDLIDLLRMRDHTLAANSETV